MLGGWVDPHDVGSSIGQRISYPSPTEQAPTQESPHTWSILNCCTTLSSPEDLSRERTVMPVCICTSKGAVSVRSIPVVGYCVDYVRQGATSARSPVSRSVHGVEGKGKGTDGSRNWVDGPMDHPPKIQTKQARTADARHDAGADGIDRVAVRAARHGGQPREVVDGVAVPILFIYVYGCVGSGFSKGGPHRWMDQWIKPTANTQKRRSVERTNRSIDTTYLSTTPSRSSWICSSRPLPAASTLNATSDSPVTVYRFCGGVG